MWSVVPGNTISLPSLVWLIEPSYLSLYNRDNILIHIEGILSPEEHGGGARLDVLVLLV